MPARDWPHAPGACAHGLDRASADRRPGLWPHRQVAWQAAEGFRFSPAGVARIGAWFHPSRNEAPPVVLKSHAARHAGTVERAWCIGFNSLGQRKPPSQREKTEEMATKKGIVSLPASGGEAGP